MSWRKSVFSDSFPAMLIASTVISLLLVIALLGRSENKNACRIFALVFALSAALDWLLPLRSSGSPQFAQIIFRVQHFAALLGFSLIDVAVLKLVGPPQTKIFPHFIPALVIGIILALVNDFYVSLGGVLISTAFSLFWTHQSLQYFQNGLKEIYAGTSQIRLGWLRSVLIIGIALWIIRFMDLVSGPDIPLWQYQSAARAIGFCFLAGYLMRHSLVFNEVRQIQLEKKEKPLPLLPEEVAHLNQKIDELFETEKPFLNPEFRLNDLAALLKLKPYQTSAFLNQARQTTFYDLVNRARIEEAKRRLRDSAYQHLNVLGVGMDCGFNSKSSFAEAFKKWTNTTPSEFRKSV